MRVTFDSNVWEHVVQPASCASDQERDQAVHVRCALEQGKLLGLFCEAWTTLEAVTKKERAGFLSKQAIGAIKVPTVVNGEPTTMVMAGPDESHRPAMNDKFRSLLANAMALGMRIMHSTRYTNVELPDAYFAGQSEDIADKTASVLYAIEERGVGRSMIRAFGLELARRQCGAVAPFSDIPDVPLTDVDQSKIGKLVAEWADGEAVACHIGYGNDVFCSHDQGGKAGQRISVLNQENRQWLSGTYGMRFMSLAELAASFLP